MSGVAAAIRRLIGRPTGEGSAASAPERGARTGAGRGPVQAVWNSAVLAESERTVLVERRHYFPPQDVNFDLLEPSEKQTACYWKGLASYHDIVVDGARNQAAAWYYPDPSEAAAGIKDHIAFWKGVAVSRAPRR